MEERSDLVGTLLVEIQQRMESKVLERLNDSKTGASLSVGNLLEDAYLEERESLKQLEAHATSDGDEIQAEICRQISSVLLPRAVETLRSRLRQN